MKVFMAFIKPIWGTTKKCENQSLPLFYLIKSLGILVAVNVNMTESNSIIVGTLLEN